MLKWKSGEIVLLAVGFLLMAAATAYDLGTTTALVAAEWKALSNIMGRTLFEGELPGANDFIVLLLFSASILYARAQKSNASLKAKAWGIDAGFILLSALVVAFLFVHWGKLTLGRARPDQVFKHGVMYTQWFTFGAHFIADGVYRGSFPSGHTAQAFIGMAPAYVLAGYPQASRLRIRLGWMLGAAALAFSLLMGTARCMSLSHWLTDVVGSIVFGWLLMHLIYYRILCIPDRHRYLMRHAKTPGLPSCWELSLGVYLLLFTIGAGMIGNGAQALLLKRALWMLFLVPPGVLLMFLTLKKIKNIHGALRSILLAP
jgi:membrane-associated phospholipid phosphatase